MPQAARRKNQTAVTWLQATGLGACTWLGLTAMHVSPGWLPVALALLAGGLALASADLGVLVAIVAFSLPLVAAQPIVGLTALILGVAAVRYLSLDGGRTFLIIGLAIIGAYLGPVWAAAAIAGYLLGSGDGALTAAVACVAVEVVGVAAGKPLIGVTITGGPVPPIVSFASAPASLVSSEWLRASFQSLSAASVNSAVSGISHVAQPAALLIQPAVWALGAIVAGMLARQARERKSEIFALASVTAGITVIAAGSVAMRGVLGIPQQSSATMIAFGTSLVVAIVFVMVWERAFPIEIVQIAPSVRRVSMAAEDADVDELLRLIATAEDKLATQHTTEKVVMITDMKSFSRMTEEDGSVLTAKAIQRHRDLLIPIIERHGGKGKSTGGDGVVAAFDTPAAAVLAAAEAQRALALHNVSHPNQREVWVRMGIAQGEVMLDKGGRPFIGAALNLAARVMNLADGGQVFATGDIVSDRIDGVETWSFGEFELKNIAKPVEVVEIMWSEGQKPLDPRANTPEGPA